ncbi:MAG: sigma-70 family RNA polymerase sigma factor [Gemmataceae bacterium]|nr:sigma-70 family RNA polymerase sigma factor [Gemmataceae bacterium]
MSSLLQQIRRTILRRDTEGLTDGQLLGWFITRREEAPFEALVRRLGPMVLGVCRRILRNPHDAEDAFQATFLVLVRKATSVVPQELVGNWLYGVAYRTAMKAKAMNSKRRAKERQSASLPRPAPQPDESWHDLQPLLDAELSGLPDKYRVPIVLCDLGGKTHKEAARQLGWPEGTVSTRLVAARRELAKRLTRRGVVLSGVSLGMVLSPHAASAAVPNALLAATVKAAGGVASGMAVTAGVVPAKVACLTEGVLKAMLLTKLKAVMMALVGVAVIASGAALLAYHGLAAGPPAAHAREEPEKREQPAKVTLLRAPEKGIQPQAAVDGKGVVHLIYFRGEPGNGDIFYVRSDDGGARFSRPLRVNSQPGSAIATGNIRGAHLAFGKNGRVHVAWMGSRKAEHPAHAHGAPIGAPMLYARLNDQGTEFEPQRNIIHAAVGLDGGGSVSADDAGNVYVTWHAPKPGDKGEENRRVWVARSTDEGKTFAHEKPISEERTGVCGCCGMRAMSDRKGNVYVLYRSATEEVHRDTYLLASKDQGRTFLSDKVQPWRVNTCPMSSFALGETRDGVLAAWETAGQVYFARIDPESGKRSEPVAAPGAGKGRKHPAVVGNDRGDTILAWTEGMGWNRGGAVAWQVFDKDGRPTAENGRSDGVPTWSLVTVVPRPDGGFTIIY